MGIIAGDMIGIWEMCDCLSFPLALHVIYTLRKGWIFRLQNATGMHLEEGEEFLMFLLPWPLVWMFRGRIVFIVLVQKNVIYMLVSLPNRTLITIILFSLHLDSLGMDKHLLGLDCCSSWPSRKELTSHTCAGPEGGCRKYVRFGLPLYREEVSVVVL